MGARSAGPVQAAAGAFALQQFLGARVMTNGLRVLPLRLIQRPQMIVRVGKRREQRDDRLIRRDGRASVSLVREDHAQIKVA